MRIVGSLFLGLALCAGACGGQTAGDLGSRGDGAGRGANQGDGQGGQASSEDSSVDPGEPQDDDWQPEDLPEEADPNDDTDPSGDVRYGYYAINGDQITLTWGSTDRACGDSPTVTCNEAKAEVTLSLQQLISQQSIDLETTQGVMTSSGVNQGGSGPDDCWWGGGSPWGQLRLDTFTEDEYIIVVTGSAAPGEPNVDGYINLIACE
ncbi:MAG: hypothetical protein H6718_20470 [Polyangiaceae bacterium]|nr:hypothetical protein [Polyangiaceae bacterium]MCB9608739.1 hypothetical protein [Polyangiaceae bacterium]